VAEACVAERKHFVTTSYVSEEMRWLHGEATRAGVLLLNEIGADPGIDHMQAMRLIHRVRRRGGNVTGFRSLCGGIPAPDSNDNPWGYKLSWSPRGVVMAGKRPARYLDHGEVMHLEAYEIFARPRPIGIEGVGELESYPNGDSLRFEEEYGLSDLDTLVRGTLRWPGWCETWTALSDLDWIDESPSAALPGSTHAEVMRRAAGARNGEPVREATARVLEIPATHAVLERLEWLGLFADTPVPAGARSRADVLVARMQETMQYRPGERDLLVLHHEVDWKDAAGAPHRIIAQMTEAGVPDGDSAMSRTVGIPAAFAARRILDGTIKETGVRIPTRPSIYSPVLADLKSVGIEETVREE
jgi:saccharopine dehydrogenase-like NADP-dependent oxidoreductase